MSQRPALPIFTQLYCTWSQPGLSVHTMLLALAVASFMPCNTHMSCFDRNSLSFCFLTCTSAFCMLCWDQCFTTGHPCGCEKLCLVWLGLGDPNRKREISKAASQGCDEHTALYLDVVCLLPGAPSMAETMQPIPGCPYPTQHKGF